MNGTGLPAARDSPPAGERLPCSPAVRANVANVANRKGFSLVLQCQIVARSTAMQTTDEPLAGAAAPLPEAAGSHDGAVHRTIDRAPVAAHGHAPSPSPEAAVLPREIGGRDGPEPTRFGDWEKAGRCIDF